MSDKPTEVVTLEVKPQLVIPSQVIVIESISVQMTDVDPTSHEHRFARDITSGETCYMRYTKVLPGKWQLLDTGWVEDPSMVILFNREGRYQTMPTDEEKAEMAGRVLQIFLVNERPEIGINPYPMLEIPPREGHRLSLVKGMQVYISTRSQSSISYTMYAVPR